ncbi:unnamed protein product [Peniophora sp. CBMAI 1063]|nr:unnamed protein product [Peniophora sp. CBMAI 1063]
MSEKSSSTESASMPSILEVILAAIASESSGHGLPLSHSTQPHFPNSCPDTETVRSPDQEPPTTSSAAETAPSQKLLDSSQSMIKRLRCKNACTNCRNRKVKCGYTRPCQQCIRRGRADTCQDGVRTSGSRDGPRGPYKQRTRMTTPYVTSMDTDAYFLALGLSAAPISGVTDVGPRLKNHATKPESKEHLDHQ